MPSRRSISRRLMLTLAAVGVWCGSGCGSDARAPSAGLDAGGSDSAPPAIGDDESHDDACAPDSTWSATSTGFAYTEWGGSPSQSGALDASCRDYNVTYEFSAETRVLSQRGCSQRGSIVERSISLRDSEVAWVVAAIRSLRTSCSRTAGALASVCQRLLVRNDTGAVQSTFVGDHDGCAMQASSFAETLGLSNLGDAMGKLLDDSEGDAADAGGDAGAARDVADASTVRDCAQIFDAAPLEKDGDGPRTIDVADTSDCGPVADSNGPNPCTAGPAWTGTTTSFAYRESGSVLSPEASPDAGCGPYDVTYEFSAVTKTLSKRGCTMEGSLADRSLSLLDSDVAGLIATVSAVRTSCLHSGRTADAPCRMLWTRDEAGMLQHLYWGEDDVCAAPKGFFADSLDLANLQRSMDDLLGAQTTEGGR